MSKLDDFDCLHCRLHFVINDFVGEFEADRNLVLSALQQCCADVLVKNSDSSAEQTKALELFYTAFSECIVISREAMAKGQI